MIKFEIHQQKWSPAIKCLKPLWRLKFCKECLSQNAMLFKEIIGAVAQLVERFHGMEEARGSIPLSSTSVCLVATNR